MTVSDWFATRTFAASDFSVDDLAERKKAEQVSVSVVLPARNEANTIVGVIEAAKSLSGLLVDEIVVLDGSSTDDTPTLAEAAGAAVYEDSKVLDEFGPCLGKGDALWRSLTVTSGDIVAFIDTDIRNPDPRFVSGLLGPLLTVPDIGYVKAYYERPMQTGGTLHPTGGGRVTELCARPLLNLFWPALAGLIQPLSGEYAGRRELLEAVPFFTGYGVEIGLLIDTAAQFGPSVIAQVDLLERIHRNQSIDSLSRMAFALLQVAMKRLDDHGHAPVADLLHTEYLQFQRGAEGVSMQPRSVVETERPPLRSLPAYADGDYSSRSHRTP